MGNFFLAKDITPYKSMALKEHSFVIVVKLNLSCFSNRVLRISVDWMELIVTVRSDSAPLEVKGGIEICLC